MLARFDHARVLEVGAYDIDGRSFPWIDLYDPDGREKVIRMSVVDGVDLSAAAFGEFVDLVCDVSNETKVLKGTDRTYVRHNVRVEQVRRSKAPGAGEPESVPAAA